MPEVYNMICLMQSLGVFFKFSPKRQRKLEKVISKTAVKDAGRLKTKVKPLCETRWVERHTSFTDLKDLYVPMLECLSNIELDENRKWDAKTVTEAGGLYRQLTATNFIFQFHDMLLHLQLHQRPVASATRVCNGYNPCV